MAIFQFIFTADGDQIFTADGDAIAVADVLPEVFIAFLTSLRSIAIEEGFFPSAKADRYDTNRGKRLHMQFWVSGRLVSSQSISQAADNVWEIVYHLAWQPSQGRSDVDFGFYELLDKIGAFNNSIQSKLCPTWDEPVNVTSASPEWNDDLKAWDVTINIETRERRTWAPTT